MFGQEKQYLIDLELDLCLKDSNNFSTAKMNECVQIAIEKWDYELQKNFDSLKTLVSKKELELIIETQNNWEVFKNSELKSLQSMYAGFLGSMWSTSYLGDKLSLIKQRAINLEWQYYARKGEIENY